MPAPQSPLVSRRQLLLGGSALAGAVLLGACGDDGEATGGTTTTTAPGGAEGLALAQFFGGAMFVAGTASRLPFGVADQDGLLPTEDTPERLTVQILGPDGTEVGEAIDVVRHAEGLPRAYFPLEATLPDAGIYTARTSVDGTATEMSFQVDEASAVDVIQVGSAMPALETPIAGDPKGVNPICTADPVCPLHDVTVAAALGEAAPVALLVATPAFCQLTICGPVLDVLLDVRGDFPDVRFLHAEVYADPAKDLQTQAPVVGELGLHFEPCLVLVAADGTVADRIDTIYDRTELTTRLAGL